MEIQSVSNSSAIQHQHIAEDDEEFSKKSLLSAATSSESLKQIAAGNSNAEQKTMNKAQIYIPESKIGGTIVHCKGIANKYVHKFQNFVVDYHGGEQQEFSGDEVNLLEKEMYLLNDYLSKNIPSMSLLHIGCLFCCCSLGTSLIPIALQMGTFEKKVNAFITKRNTDSLRKHGFEMSIQKDPVESYVVITRVPIPRENEPPSKQLYTRRK